MSNSKYIEYRYINPETNEHYMTRKVKWDEIYDGKLEVIEVYLKPENNYLE